MEYGNLETYAQRMLELNGNDHGLKAHRLRAERDRYIFAIQNILRPSVRRMTNKKNLSRDLQDEFDQHTNIAIMKALSTWDPIRGKFSTHVHWEIRAELQIIQHFQHPERRRLVVATPIRKIELDRPVINDEGGSASLMEILKDEQADENVVSGAEKYIAMRYFERVLSHYVCNRFITTTSQKSDPDFLSKIRRGIMRNLSIYVRRVLEQDTYETISNYYDITRERSRQIIAKTNKDLKGQLPFQKTNGEIIEASFRYYEDVHPMWNDLVYQHYADTGIDARIVNKGTPFNVGVEDTTEALPNVVVVEQTQADIVAELDRSAPVNQPVVRDNVISLAPARVSLARSLRQAAITAGAGAMLTAAVAAHAQSRAVPPESPAPAKIERVERQASVVETIKPARKAPTASGAAKSTPRLVSITKISVGKNAWGVKVADFESEQAARDGWKKETRDWNWLKGLQPAYIQPTGSSVRHAVAFGPLSEQQARGMCLEARRYRKECSVVRFGMSKEVQG